jgi:hypothetical protein
MGLIPWGKLSKEERARYVEMTKAMKNEGLTYAKIAECFEEKGVKVSGRTLSAYLNPKTIERFKEKIKMYRERILNNRDDILTLIEKNPNLSNSEIVEMLKGKYNLIPSQANYIMKAVKKLIDGNPYRSLTKYECFLVHDLGGANYIKKLFGKPLRHENYGDMKNISEELKIGPKTTHELSKVKKGKSQIGGIISDIREKTGIKISSLKVPFSQEVVYYFPGHENSAFIKARELAKEYLSKSFYLGENTVDENRRNFLLQLIDRDYMTQEEIKRFEEKNKKLFKMLRKNNLLKEINIGNEIFYSLWPEKLEGLKTKSEFLSLSKELFS